MAAAGNYYRGLFAGGTTANDLNRSSSVTTVDYITFGATGSSTDFGDLTSSRSYLSGTSSSTEAFFSGGTQAPGTENTTIEKVAFESKANTASFGTLSRANRHHTSTSNANGGLGVDPGLTETDLSTSGTAIFAGGADKNASMQSLNLNSASNSVEFGELSIGRKLLGSAASSTRSIFAGGNSPTATNHSTIDYVTIASTGNSEFFGFLSQARHGLAGLNSPTRGVFGGGASPGVSSRIDYVTIATTGNASTFGDLTEGRRYLAACSNGTRGVFGGGHTPSPSSQVKNTIDYITIATTGNATDFGDLT